MPETNFFWDPLSDNILQERDDSAAVTAEYTTEPGLYGNLISQNREGAESQYHFDAVGSTLALTDDIQQVTDTYAYTAFGEVTEHIGSTVNPFQYVGVESYYRDDVAREYLVRRRSLSASRGQWLSIDPMDVITRSLQVYRYARNSPLTHHDPSGLLEKGNCSAYYITHLLPKPTPWKTADFPKAKAGKLEGLTIVDEWSITCTCKTRRCIDVPEGVVGWFTCPPGTARLCCDIVLKIPFILISADVDKDLRIWIWGHEMFHVRHYQDKTREVWGRLGKSQECLPASECDEQKKKTLDDIQKELQAFADDEAQHKNFKDPKPGEYYAFPTPPEFPHAPIGHEPKPPIEIK